MSNAELQLTFALSAALLVSLRSDFHLGQDVCLAMGMLYMPVSSDLSAARSLGVGCKLQAAGVSKNVSE